MERAMCYMLRAMEGMLRIRDWLLVTGYWDASRFNKSFSKKNKPTLVTLHPKGTCPFGRAHSSLFADEVFL